MAFSFIEEGREQWLFQAIELYLRWNRCDMLPLQLQKTTAEVFDRRAIVPYMICAINSVEETKWTGACC